MNHKVVAKMEELCSLSTSQTTPQTTEEKLRCRRERERAYYAAETTYSHGQSMYLLDDYSKDGHHSWTYLHAATCKPSVTCLLDCFS